MSTNVNKPHCHCKKSHCLKLYCECLQRGLYCDGCSCVDCRNHSGSMEGEAIISQIRERRRQCDASELLKCSCKNSMCLKKYCECFKLSRYCGKNCTCINCKNKESAKQIPASPDFSLVDFSRIEHGPSVQDRGMQITDDELIDLICTDGREMEISLDECDVHAIMESIAFSRHVSPDIIEREMQKVVALVEQKSVRSRNSTAKRRRDWMQNDIITSAPIPYNSAKKCDATPEKRSKISDNDLLACENHDTAYLCDEHGAKLNKISSRKSCVVGSDPKIASICLNLPGVAPAHATIMCDGQKWLIRDDSSCPETAPCVLLNGTRIPKGQAMSMTQGNPSKLQFLPLKKVFYFHEKPPTNPVLGTVQETQGSYKLAGNVYWPQHNSVRRNAEVTVDNFESDTFEETEYESTQSTWFEDWPDSKSTASCDSFMCDDDLDEDNFDQGTGIKHCD